MINATPGSIVKEISFSTYVGKPIFLFTHFYRYTGTVKFGYFGYIDIFSPSTLLVGPSRIAPRYTG